MEKVKQKNSRLLKAGELHRFNLQVNDIVANLKEKQNKISVNDLGDDVITTESKVREHDAAMNELEAVNRQIKSAEETAKKLMASYPGKRISVQWRTAAFIVNLYIIWCSLDIIIVPLFIIKSSSLIQQ